MPFDPDEHHRRSIRRPGYDYAAAGAYFVTLCAHNRSCLFGEVVNGEMVLNDAGRMVARVWQSLPERFTGIDLDEFLVMPNHMHGVLLIRPDPPRRDEPRVRPAPHGGEPAPARPHGTAEGSLGRILQAFKSITTTQYIEGVTNQGWRRFSGHLWQRDYFDHVIRNQWSFEAICSYVRTNPQRWEQDTENPDGGGKDDVRAWVRALASSSSVTGSDPSAGKGESPAEESEGEHEVRPYGVTATGGGRTRGSPLRARIGHGYDLHRLAPGPRLVLAGVTVSEDLRPVAHSDGDVVLHALVDALLGAMGWGDIGEHFPNTDARWKDAPSRVFVETVYAKVRSAGYAVGNVDVTILAEKPKINSYKPAMLASLAVLLGVGQDRVNVKAGTNEGCDAIGRGEAVAAHAVILLVAAD